MTAVIKTLPTQEQPYARIAVIGGGAGGTALASVAASAGRTVRLFARDPETVAA